MHPVYEQLDDDALREAALAARGAELEREREPGRSERARAGASEGAPPSAPPVAAAPPDEARWWAMQLGPPREAA